jgi:hypothetical protein
MFTAENAIALLTPRLATAIDGSDPAHSLYQVVAHGLRQAGGEGALSAYLGNP